MVLLVANPESQRAWVVFFGRVSSDSNLVSMIHRIKTHAMAPTISRFYGIRIYINFREHNPPHFHAAYGDFEAAFNMSGELMAGNSSTSSLSTHEPPS